MWGAPEVCCFVYLFEEEHPAQRKQPRKFLASNNLQRRGNSKSYIRKYRTRYLSILHGEAFPEFKLLNAGTVILYPKYYKIFSSNQISSRLFPGILVTAAEAKLN